MPDDERPVLHCLVARPLPGGNITRTTRVTLGTALAYFKAGWAVIGPDPEDEAALAEWERSRQQP